MVCFPGSFITCLFGLQKLHCKLLDYRTEKYLGCDTRLARFREPAAR